VQPKPKGHFCMQAMVYLFLSASAWFAGAPSGPRHLWVSAPEERRTSMGKYIRTLVMVLLLVVGTTPLALARDGHGGSHGGLRGGAPGGGHRGFHGGRPGGDFRHRGFSGRFDRSFRGRDFAHGGFYGRGFQHFHRPYVGSGIYFDVSPFWVAPAPSIVVPQPYIAVTPEPPALWYYCTTPPGYYPMVPSCNVPWTPVPPQ
jgi:hypothetical protein